MGRRVAVTVNRPRDEVERRWREADPLPDASVSFSEAPGDRGTEIHAELPTPGGVARAVQKVAGAAALAKAKDELRRFKQVVETGEVPRSDGTPEGEAAERKLKQRPAQPLEDSELEKAGAS